MSDEPDGTAWDERLHTLFRLASFHCSDHREAGSYDAVGRSGTRRTFPLLSVSISAVAVEAEPGATADWVDERLRRAKALAKSRPGNSCVLASHERLIDLLSQSELAELPLQDAARLSILA